MGVFWVLGPYLRHWSIRSAPSIHNFTLSSLPASSKANVCSCGVVGGAAISVMKLATRRDFQGAGAGNLMRTRHEWGCTGEGEEAKRLDGQKEVS